MSSVATRRSSRCGSPAEDERTRRGRRVSGSGRSLPVLGIRPQFTALRRSRACLGDDVVGRKTLDPLGLPSQPPILARRPMATRARACRAGAVEGHSLEHQPSRAPALLPLLGAAGAAWSGAWEFDPSAVCSESPTLASSLDRSPAAGHHLLSSARLPPEQARPSGGCAPREQLVERLAARMEWLAAAPMPASPEGAPPGGARSLVGSVAIHGESQRGPGG